MGLAAHALRHELPNTLKECKITLFHGPKRIDPLAVVRDCMLKTFHHLMHSWTKMAQD